MFDYLLSTFVPLSCVVCRQESVSLHKDCWSALDDYTPQCFYCGASSSDAKTCSGCRSAVNPEAVYVFTRLTGAAKDLISRYKFAQTRADHSDIAAAMIESLPLLMPGFSVVPVPTATSHVRQRGFDHTQLLAKKIAKLKSLPYLPALQRVANHKQVGSTRQQRLVQQQNAFLVTPRASLPERVLLIDDVATTGATLSACARTLRKSGVKHVYACVFAKSV